MKKLFIIDGAAGVGKTVMLNYIRQKSKSRQNFSYIIDKYTTRKKRLEEVNRSYSMDLKHISNKKFDELFEKEDFVFYEYGNFRYGFFKRELEDAIEKYENIFVIMRSYDLAHAIINTYSKVQVILVYICSDKTNVLDRLKSEGYNQEAINFRINRINTSWEDYLKHSHKHQEVLINNSSKNDYKRLINSLVEKYNNNTPKDKLIE